MPLDPNVFAQIDQSTPSRLAQLFDPTVIQARQFQQAQQQEQMAQLNRASKLRDLLGGANTADPGQLSQTLSQNGFADEALKYQGLADAQRQRQDAEMQRRVQLIAGANARIGAKRGTPEAIQEEYGALGFMTPEQIKSKIDWVAANLKPEESGDYFLDNAFPERITKREEARRPRLANVNGKIVDLNDPSNIGKEVPPQVPFEYQIGPDGVVKMRPGVLQAKTAIAAAGANAGGVPMTVVQTENGPIQVPTRGGGPAQPVIDPNTGKQVKPASASPKIPAEVQRQIGGVIQLDKDLDALKSEMAGFDPRSTDVASVQKRARIQSIAKQVQLSAKEAAALGALSGPDMGLLEGILADPTSMKGVLNGKGGVLEQIEQAKAGNRRRIESISDQYGESAVQNLPEGLRPKRKAQAQASGGFKYLGKE